MDATAGNPQARPPGPVAGWPATEMETIDMADHFLGGRTHWVADRVATWFGERSPRNATS